MSYTVRVKILDLFCGPGGAARGYRDAGFEVVGVDINPQPSFPYEFIQADALWFLDEVDLSGFGAIHASPPCQRFSSLSHCRLKEKGLTPEQVYPNLIPDVRERLEKLTVPWVIENVEGAPIRNPLTLCGTMWGKKIRWHRCFETNFEVYAPGKCDHSLMRYNPFARKGHALMKEELKGTGIAPETRHAMERGIDPSWMRYTERRQAIPPYYSEYIGRRILELC